MNASIRIFSYIIVTAAMCTLSIPSSAQGGDSYPENGKQMLLTPDRKQNEEAFKRGVSLYRKRAFGAALMELESLYPRMKEEAQQDLAEYYILASKAALNGDNTAAYIEEYLNRTTNDKYRNMARLLLGEEMMKSGRLREADSLFGLVQEKRLPKGLISNFKYNRAYLSLIDGQLEEAKEGFRYVHTQQDEHYTDAGYYLAYIAYLQKDYDQALKGFEAVVNEDGDAYPKARVYIAQIHFVRQDYPYILDQRSDLEKLDIDGATTQEIRRMIGVAYYATGDYGRAVEYLERYRENGGRINREERYLLGYSYYMLNNYGRAISEFQQIIEGEDKLTQNAYYHLGDASLKNGDKGGAMKAFSMAAGMTQNPQISEDALYNYAKLSYENSGSDLYTQKIELMKRYLNKYPDSDRTNEMRQYLFSLYLNSSDYDAAMAEFRNIRNPSPEIKKAIERLSYERGMRYMESKQYPEAISLFDQTIGYGYTPKYTALSKLWKAEALFRQGTYDERVIGLYQDYIRSSQPSLTENQMAHYNIAYIRFNRQEWAEATDWFNRFISRYQPDDAYKADAYLRLGDIRYTQRDYKGANDYYRKAIDLNAGSADYPEYQMAINYGLMGRPEDKIRSLQAISKNRNSSYSDLATLELGATYIRQNRFAEGDKVLKQFTAERPESAYYVPALLELGMANINLNDPRKALGYYKTIVEKYPQAPEVKDAMTAIKGIYVSEGNADGYLAFAEKAGSEYKVGDEEKEQLAFDALQQLYVKSDYDGLIASTDAYLKNYPQGAHASDATFFRAESLLKKGDTKQAAETFEKLIAMPNNQYTSASLEYAANLYRQAGDTDKEYAALLKLYRQSTNPSQKRAALAALMAGSLRSDDTQRQTETSELVLADKDADAETLSLARFVSGRDLYNAGKYAQAAETLTKVKLPASRAEGIQSQFLIADAYVKLKKDQEAERQIQKIAGMETDHQYWVARSFLLLGDIYLSRGDKFQAKATYQSVADGYENPNDGIRKTAREKLSKLTDKQ